MKHIAQPQMHLMKLDSVVPNYHASEGNNKERKEKAELLKDPTRAFLQQSSSSVWEFRRSMCQYMCIICHRVSSTSLLPCVEEMFFFAFWKVLIHCTKR